VLAEFLAARWGGGQGGVSRLEQDRAVAQVISVRGSDHQSD